MDRPLPEMPVGAQRMAPSLRSLTTTACRSPAGSKLAWQRFGLAPTPYPGDS
jgi:hypothetical protein